MARSTFSERFFKALPFVYVGGGLLLMLALQSRLALFGGLILMAVGGIELLRRSRFRRAAPAPASQPMTQLHADDGESSTQALMQIAWRKSFECGHPVIDGQHRALFQIGGRLINAVLKNQTRNHIESLLDELTTHIQEHFSTEEAVLARTRYPLTDEHKIHHTVLLKRAQTLRDRYRSGLLDLSELVGFIAYDVITEHIVKEDLKFALKALHTDTEAASTAPMPAA